MLRVLADNIKLAATFHDLAMIAHLLYGTANLHNFDWLQTAHDSPPPAIRAHLKENSVARQNADVVYLHLAGEMRENRLFAFP